jgi:hypothetical protein
MSKAKAAQKEPTVPHLYELTLVGQAPELVIAYSFRLTFGTLTFWMAGAGDKPLARVHAPGTWTSVLERDPQ